MMAIKDSAEVKDLVGAAKHILVLQADNPDADSLGSALALEAILGEQDKQVSMYCAVDIPEYLKYLEGWSRVSGSIPTNFDLSIIVDASSAVLFEKARVNGDLARISAKPCIVLDHHEQTANDLAFSSVVINRPDMSATCELIYELCKELQWAVPADALDYVANGILGDTQGLSNQLASAHTYRLMAELIDGGVNRPKLEEARRERSKMPESIYRYKATLIAQTELAADGQIAYTIVNQQDINNYSPLYNPGPLIQPDMLQIESVRLGIVFKVYDNGTVTAMIRANNGAGVADKLAVHFGGGGHAYASGFKVTDGRKFQDILTECLKKATELLGSTV